MSDEQRSQPIVFFVINLPSINSRDLARLSASEHDRLWSALGVVVRLIALARQRPEPESQPTEEGKYPK